MKKWSILVLTGLLTLLWTSASWAIEFKLKGQWNMGFAIGDTSLIYKTRNGAGVKHKASSQDVFAARQRLLIQMDAIASDNLEGSVQFHIGPQQWGRAGWQGGALGADSNQIIKVRQAYIDWLIPGTSVRTRMGIQNFALPNAAGGSAVFDLRAAAINLHTDFNDTFGLNFMWFRPFNDNYAAVAGDNSKDSANYLDNMDFFVLTLPMNFESVELTPWAMFGIRGRNTGEWADYRNNGLWDGAPAVSMTPYLAALSGGGGLNVVDYGRTSKSYGSMFWAGLPLKVKAFAPFNFELDLNYGYVEEMGRFTTMVRNNPNDLRRGSTLRQGWLVKALMEYKMDWGTPGLFGWYSSGDDGDIKNGSERMPGVSPYVYTTSFMGDGNLYWSPRNDFQDLNVSLAGTWGIGLQLADMSFLEDLTHTFRAAWWGGTNSPSMVKFMDSAYAWNSTTCIFDGPYLTTNDGLLELNLVNVYKIYENLDINVELGYIANYMDDGTWKRSWNGFGSYDKQDIWKAHMIVTYKF
ncbi:MAG: outer membrane homotrimeric porin [Desulfovibrio sp.]|nr:outer membrane homotrimeric porin [Desulfovibrio sp.]